MKTCYICKRELPDDHFIEKNPYCRECRTEYMRNYRKNRPLKEPKVVNAKGCPCNECNYINKHKGCKCETFRQWFRGEWNDIREAARRKKCGY